MNYVDNLRSGRDIFKEHLVVVESTGKTVFIKAVILIAAVTLGFLGLVFGGLVLGPLIIVGVFFGARYLFTSLNLEYEYALTNDELDIDKIINKERRKELLTITVEEIDIMAHTTDQKHQDRLEKAEKTIDVSSGEEGADTYAILFNRKGISTKLIFEPSESIRKGIFRQAPSKVFLKS